MNQDRDPRRGRKHPYEFFSFMDCHPRPWFYDRILRTIFDANNCKVYLHWPGLMEKITDIVNEYQGDGPVVKGTPVVPEAAKPAVDKHFVWKGFGYCLHCNRPGSAAGYCSPTCMDAARRLQEDVP